MVKSSDGFLLHYRSRVPLVEPCILYRAVLSAVVFRVKVCNMGAGRWLRKFKIEEIQATFSVLRGGSRPSRRNATSGRHV